LKTLKIAGFPIPAGIDTTGIVQWGEIQIRSKQDWERGLRGGEIENIMRCSVGALIATRGATEGIEMAPDWAVYSDGRSELRVSVIDPW
jgi:hypothetical protein